MTRLSTFRPALRAFTQGVFFYMAVMGGCAVRTNAAELAILRNGSSIRHEHRLVIENSGTTRLFTSADDSSYYDVPTADIEGFEKDLSVTALSDSAALKVSVPGSNRAGAKSASPAKPAVPLSDVVNMASANYHLDPDLVNSVIHAESGFNPRAVSPKGARGLMQLMPQTANSLGVNDAFDPQDNVEGGSKYLRELLERYNFDLVKALAAYNAGPLRVQQYGGVPPYRETHAYVQRIVHEYNKKKIAQEKAEKAAKAAQQKQLTAKRPAKGAAKATATKPTGATVAQQQSPAK